MKGVQSSLQVLNRLPVDRNVNITLYTELLPLKTPRSCAGCFIIIRQKGVIAFSGGRGIRTPGAVNPAVFKTAAIDHSAIPPRMGFPGSSSRISSSVPPLEISFKQPQSGAEQSHYREAYHAFYATSTLIVQLGRVFLEQVTD